MSKWTPVFDPDEIAALTNEPAGSLGVPFFFAPNGHLWVDSAELRMWREYRAAQMA